MKKIAAIISLLLLRVATAADYVFVRTEWEWAWTVYDVSIRASHRLSCKYELDHWRKQ